MCQISLAYLVFGLLRFGCREDDWGLDMFCSRMAYGPVERRRYGRRDGRWDCGRVGLGGLWSVSVLA